MKALASLLAKAGAKKEGGKAAPPDLDKTLFKEYQEAVKAGDEDAALLSLKTLVAHFKDD